MEDFDNALVLSMASLWEMAIKISIGKLELLKEFDSLIPEKLEENEIEVLPIRLAHLSEMMKLPFHHRDPFDRLIIAQSISEDLPLIAHDGIFKEYPADIVPVRGGLCGDAPARRA
uniref:PIN domain nuclease, a component of toxin-antitoxin system (PIN domain) n=1 Tax=Candidatus Kentrum sp. FM TaxID=2126340 RepID=A0A450U1D9_9GAMM|nr:MAG: PIN domain nuclease, a component of toxin-antitoxin system (PIN domain) [Candidatus Kentron sp. FM]VFJ76082.1 MAG: PIN domain nuclease, a component of toxin-antitoxin system (PIN domain) [Candidatus Kentron sp. FM]VFK14883.1 MAG: PIN domain nuclease, a component of toxin-antitoxin system (PIN domain) [Candidatus Kentron sp. FM]